MDVNAKSRRRSLSASRTLDSTVNFVGRIGASLRISSRKRAKEKQKLHHICDNSEENWLQSGVHYAKIGIERRRSACSAIFLETKNAPKLYFADEDCTEENEDKAIKVNQLKEPENLTISKPTGLETHHQKRYQVRSNSVMTSRDCQLALFSQRATAEYDACRRASGCLGNARRPTIVRQSHSNVDFGAPGANLSDDECGEENLLATRFIDEDADEDEDEDERDTYVSYYTKSSCAEDNDEDGEFLNLALVPLPYPGASPSAALRATATAALTRSAVSSSMSVTSNRAHTSTPQTPSRRRYLREGATQLTSLRTLCTHNRYLFLFNDLLLVSKQKGENSYKLKQKVSLDRLWVSSNNCKHSFLIGWPIQNYVAHFSSEVEKNEWFTKLSDSICQRQQLTHPHFTTVNVAVRIEGRQQLIRREVENGIRASELVQELIEILDLPALDSHLFFYELCFESGGSNGISGLKADTVTEKNQSTTTAAAVVGTLNFNTSANFHAAAAPVTNSSSFLTSSPNAQITALNGVESVYAIFMDHVFNSGISLSDSQLAHLDTSPHVNCRLVLRKSAVHIGHAGSTSALAALAGAANSATHSRSSAALNLVNHFRKVLSRADSSQKSKLFGRQLEGSMPPQPVLTMIDHLTIHGAQIEGIFRKCAKQATVRILKSQLDQGQVPDFHQFNIHVTASLLKEYLRSIPGQLLISANYHLWMEVIVTKDAEKRLRTCKNLLRLLPHSHTVLLRSVLRLLRRIVTEMATSKMNVDALAVCLAPSLLENPNIVDSARRVPDLAAYLIKNANELFDEFVDDTLIVPVSTSAHEGSTTGSDESGILRYGLHHSTDSGLSDDLTNGTSTAMAPIIIASNQGAVPLYNKSSTLLTARSSSVSPDSALFEIPTSEASSSSSAVPTLPFSLNGDSFDGIHIEEIESNPSRFDSNMLTNNENDDSDDRTPVLSRENSDVKTQFPNRYQWRSHLSDSRISQISEHSAINFNSDTRISCLKPNIITNSTSVTSGKHAISNVVSSVDELRVRNFIGNNPKVIRNKAVVQSQREHEAELDELYAAISGRISASPVRKISNISMESSQRPGRKISATSNISDSSQVTPRRSTLVTKKDVLGITSVRSNGHGVVPPINNTVKRSPQTVVMAKASLNRKSAQNSETAKVYMESKERPPRFEGRKYSTNANEAQSVASKLKLKQTNSSSIRANLTRTSSSRERANVTIEASALRTLSKTRRNDESQGCVSRTIMESSSEYGNSTRNIRLWAANSQPKENDKPSSGGAIRVARRQSDRRPTVSSLTGADMPPSGNVSRNLKASKSSGPSVKPWRPPKRTAEEIVLDKNLEVNWSVSSIRSVFQNQKDDKPAAIDTVYAKIEATQNAKV